MCDEGSWIAGLEVGDEVATASGYSHGRWTFHTIDRLTKTQIIVGPLRFRRNNGRQIGGSECNRAYLMPPTEERKAAELIARARAFLDNTEGWHKLLSDKDAIRLARDIRTCIKDAKAEKG